jgi:hypothetical protein
MKDSTALLVFVLVLFLLTSSSPVIPRSSAAPQLGPAAGPPQPPLPGTPAYTNIVPNLPFLHDSAAVLAPVWSHVGQPLVNALNKNVSRPINWAIGGQTPTTTVNPDGTIRRAIAKPNWYSRNVGEPISHAVTGAVHTVEGWFS